MRIGHHKAPKLAVIGQLAALRSGNTKGLSAIAIASILEERSSYANATPFREAKARLAEHDFFTARALCRERCNSTLGAL